MAVERKYLLTATPHAIYLDPFIHLTLKFSISITYFLVSALVDVSVIYHRSQRLLDLRLRSLFLQTRMEASGADSCTDGINNRKHASSKTTTHTHFG